MTLPDEGCASTPCFPHPAALPGDFSILFFLLLVLTVLTSDALLLTLYILAPPFPSTGQSSTQLLCPFSWEPVSSPTKHTQPPVRQPESPANSCWGTYTVRKAPETDCSKPEIHAQSLAEPENPEAIWCIVRPRTPEAKAYLDALLSRVTSGKSLNPSVPQFSPLKHSNSAHYITSGKRIRWAGICTVFRTAIHLLSAIYVGHHHY